MTSNVYHLLALASSCLLISNRCRQSTVLCEGIFLMFAPNKAESQGLVESYTKPLKMPCRPELFLYSRFYLRDFLLSSESVWGAGVTSHLFLYLRHSSQISSKQQGRDWPSRWVLCTGWTQMDSITHIYTLLVLNIDIWIRILPCDHILHLSLFILLSG